MTTFSEIDLKNALAIYAQQNSIDLSEDDCWRLPNGNRSGFSNIDVVEWLHGTVVKPTEQQLIIIHDNFVSQIQTETVTTNKINDIDNVRGLLRNKVLKELIANTINTTTLKNELEVIINSNAQALLAFNRTATLWGLDTTNTLNYIRVCYLLTAIAT